MVNKAEQRLKEELLKKLEEKKIHTKIERLSESENLIRATYGDVVKWSDIEEVFKLNIALTTIA